MEEKDLQGKNGMTMLFLSTLAYLLSIAVFIMGCVILKDAAPLGIIMIVLGGIWVCFGWILFLGLKILKAPGSVGADSIRQIYRDPEGRRILLR